MKQRTYRVFLSMAAAAPGFYDGEMMLIATQEDESQEVGTVVLGTPVPVEVILEALIFTIAAHMYDAVEQHELNLNAQQLIRESMPVFDPSEQDYMEVVLDVWGENDRLPPNGGLLGGNRVTLMGSAPVTLTELLANMAKESMGGTLPGFIP